MCKASGRVDCFDRIDCSCVGRILKPALSMGAKYGPNPSPQLYLGCAGMSNGRWQRETKRKPGQAVVKSCKIWKNSERLLKDLTRSSEPLGIAWRIPILLKDQLFLHRVSCALRSPCNILLPHLDVIGAFGSCCVTGMCKEPIWPSELNWITQIHYTSQLNDSQATLDQLHFSIVMHKKPLDLSHHQQHISCSGWTIQP